MNNQQIKTESQLTNQQKPSPLQPIKLEQLDFVSGGASGIQVPIKVKHNL